jgi:type IV pilus assembly protein PilE
MFVNTKPLKSQKAFTIMELMIVVVIISILSMLVYPSYQASIVKARRADAKGALLSFANAMERYFTENNNSYCGAGTTTAGGCVNATGAPNAAVFVSQSPVGGGTPYYNLTITPSATTVVTSITATTYNLRATPIGTQAGDGILEIKNTESRGRWDRNNDGDTNDSGEGSWD